MLGTIIDDNSHIDHDVAMGMVRISAFLQHLDGAMQRLLGSPNEIDLSNHKQDKTIAIKRLVDSAVTQCFYDPGKGRDLAESMARLCLVSGNAFWIVTPVATPDRFRLMTSRFPEIGNNTTTGLQQLRAAVFEALAAAGKDPRTASLKEFTDVLASGYRSTLASLIDLDRVCTDTMAHDAAALKSISTGYTLMVFPILLLFFILFGSSAGQPSNLVVDGRLL